MKRRTRTAASLVAVAALVTAGCSGAAGGQDSGDVTLKVVAWPGQEGDAYKAVIEAYNQGPGKDEGIKAEIVLVSSENTFSKEATEMAAKSSDTDIYFTASYLAQQHAPALETFDGLKPEDYFDSAIESFTIDGELKAVPMGVSHLSLLYRTDLIGDLLDDEGEWERYGDLSEEIVGERLEPKDPQEGWTWDDYMAAAAYFSKSLNPDSPTEYGTHIGAKNADFGTMFWDDVLWGRGGHWLDDNGQPALNSEAASAAMDQYRTLFEKKMVPEESAVSTFPQLQATMQAEAAPFVHQWIAAYDPLNDPEQSPNIAGNVEIAPPPGGKTHVHYLGLGVNKHGDHVEEATKVLEYFASKEGQTVYAQNAGIPAFPEVLKENEEYNSLFEYVAEWVDEYGYVEPNIQGVSQYQVFIGLAEALSAGWVNAEPAESALDKAQTFLEQQVGGK